MNLLTMLPTLCTLVSLVIIISMLASICTLPIQPAVPNPAHLRYASDALTTGGSVYRDGEDGPTSSPTGGNILCAGDDEGTDRALSALRRNEEGPPNGELPLFRRNLVCTGDTG